MIDLGLLTGLPAHASKNAKSSTRYHTEDDIRHEANGAHNVPWNPCPGYHGQKSSCHHDQHGHEQTLCSIVHRRPTLLCAGFRTMPTISYRRTDLVLVFTHFWFLHSQQPLQADQSIRNTILS